MVGGSRQFNTADGRRPAFAHASFQASARSRRSGFAAEADRRQTHSGRRRQELGYLHPPLGLNLLLASYRFKKPVLEVTMATLPMLGILAAGVLLITYVPWLTEGWLQLMGRL